MNWMIKHKDITESTNIDAWAFGKTGCPSGVVCTASSQTAGRGRMERIWYSPIGKGLYVSVMIRPEIRASDVGLLSFCAANAMYSTLVDAGAKEPAIKWPNDLVCGEKKICGILSSCDIRDNKLEFAVIGAGLNIKKGAYPSELSDRATSLEESDCYIQQEDLLRIYLGYLSAELKDIEGNGFLHIRERLIAHCITIGRDVVVSGADTFTGKAITIGDQGELLVEHADGKIVSVYSGDVSVRGINSYI